MSNPRSGANRSTGRVPEVWGRIPPRNKNFTGREELLERLREGVAGQVAVIPHALHGLGGVGKTQMAIEYAYRFRAEYDVVWWVPADQPFLVRSSLAALAPHLDLPSAQSGGVEDAAEAVLDALRRGEPYDKWLLIFDNADQPEDLNDMLPRGPGHILITSRNHRWARVVDTVPVDVFTREESIAFLGKRVPRGIENDDADRLADALGDLPLALEQAGALQAETGMGVREYLRLLRERTSQLLAEGKPGEYPVSMTAAWELSVASLSEKLPEAVELLRRCAFFGPEPIPRDAFSRPRGLELSAELNALISDPIRLSRMVGELGRFALARLDIPARTIQVHRLIQALLRDESTPEEQRRMRDEVQMLLAGHAPHNAFEPGNWARFGQLLGHVVPARVGESVRPEVRDFALNILRYLWASGDSVSARDLAEQTFLPMWTEASGEEHPDVLELRMEQANILRELADYRAAAEVNRSALRRAEKVLDQDHWLRLALLRAESADLRVTGDFRRARERDERLLRLSEAKYGRERVQTVLTMNNLAVDCLLNSEFVRSRELLQEAFQRLESIGEAPARTIMTVRSGLARAVRLCGDYPEACDLGEDAYAYGIERFGPEYKWTLLTAKDLSIAWRRDGELERARELAEEVHTRAVRLYDLNHPDTLAAALCLANLRRTSGDSEQAMELVADASRRYSRVYGTDHPYTRSCIGNLAVMHRVLDEPREARKKNEHALAGLENRLGRDHHYTLTVATNLASDLAALGEWESAVQLGRDTLRRLEVLLGADHPTTLCCAANLTSDLRVVGEDGAAAELFERTKASYARTLGLDHPDARAFLAGGHLDADFDPPPI